jgi:hypothetical protein
MEKDNRNIQLNPEKVTVREDGTVQILDPDIRKAILEKKAQLTEEEGWLNVGCVVQSKE